MTDHSKLALLWLAPALAALALTLACDDGGGKVPSNWENVTIILERTPCFGDCPVYKLTISGDGTATYEGERFVEVAGVQTAQVSSKAIRDLVQEFYDIYFFSLPDGYECPVTDASSAITSISIGSLTKTIHDYAPGFRPDEFLYCAAPEELVALENRIDEVAGSARWVGAR